MSMLDDNSPGERTPNEGVMSDDMFTADEAAAFEQMRGGDGQTAPMDPAPAPAPAPQDPATPPAADGSGQEHDPADLPDVDVIEADGKTRSRRVSLNKFLRVEKLAKDREQQLQSFQQQFQQQIEERARLDERLRIINEAITSQHEQAQQQQAHQQAPQMPDPDTDIFGAVKFLAQQIAAQNQQSQQVSQTLQQRDAEADIKTRYEQKAIEFAAKQPAFFPAYNHLYKSRDAQLAAIGIADPMERRRAIVREEQNLVKSALAAGIDPAERIYAVSLAMGFQPQVAPPQQQGTPAAPAGAVPPAGNPPSPQPGGTINPQLVQQAAQMARAVPQQPGNGQPGNDVAAQVAAIARGQQAAQSLSTVGGGAVPGNLTMESLLAMGEEEFGELVDRLPRGKLMDILGH